MLGIILFVNETTLWIPNLCAWQVTKHKTATKSSNCMFEFQLEKKKNILKLIVINKLVINNSLKFALRRFKYLDCLQIGRKVRVGTVIVKGCVGM